MYPSMDEFEAFCRSISLVVKHSSNQTFEFEVLLAGVSKIQSQVVHSVD